MRATNASISCPSHAIVSQGEAQTPADFPATLADLLILSDESCDSLLAHYNIAFQNNSTVAAKRVLLATFLGIRCSCLP